MSTSTEQPTEPGAEQIPYDDKPEGPISAAILAAGIGALAMGVVTTLSAASKSVADALNWYDRVGPLSGKTIITILVWLAAWAILHMALRRKTYESTRALVISLVLIGLGVVGTFPTFFQAFE